MCGRFTLRTPTETIADMFAGLEVHEIQPSYNIAPTQGVYAVRQVDSVQELTTLRWGLVPFWATDKKIGNRMINARGESVQDKPSFRSAFKKRRCLILADGYYEWQKTPDGKQPMYMHLADDRPFCFAGLWERNFKLEEPIESCTVITTDASPNLSNIHDRMPVILAPGVYETWLDPGFENHDLLGKMLVPYAEDDLIATPVSTKVNKPAYNQPDCIQPIQA